MREIENLQRVLQVQLPEQYRRFLLQYNGGVPDPALNCLYRIPQEFQSQFAEGFDLVVVHCFYFVKSPIEACALIGLNIDYRGRIPSDTIMIASDPFGDQFLLGVGKENTDRIYYWDHDSEGFDPPEDMYHNVAQISPSFERFIDSLEPNADR